MVKKNSELKNIYILLPPVLTHLNKNILHGRDKAVYVALSGSDIHIITDSNAAISCLENVFSTSWIVQEYRMPMEPTSYMNMKHMKYVGVSLSKRKQLSAHKFHLTANQRGFDETFSGETRKIWPIIAEKVSADFKAILPSPQERKCGYNGILA